MTFNADAAIYMFPPASTATATTDDRLADLAGTLFGNPPPAKVYTV
jgi:hypothetical protein